MADVIGLVSRVQLLPDRPGMVGAETKHKGGLYSISIEGIGALGSGDRWVIGPALNGRQSLPVEGMTVVAVFEVQWRQRGEKPLHWLRSWRQVRMQAVPVDQVPVGGR